MASNASKHTFISLTNSFAVNISDIGMNSEYSFGYFWWIDPTRQLHFMWGHGGQFAFIMPALDLLIVMTSIPNTQGDYQIQADEALRIVDMIIDAID